MIATNAGILYLEEKKIKGVNLQVIAYQVDLYASGCLQSIRLMSGEITDYRNCSGLSDTETIRLAIEMFDRAEKQIVREAGEAWTPPNEAQRESRNSRSLADPSTWRDTPLEGSEEGGE